jgi:hypothetical protein
MSMPRKKNGGLDFSKPPLAFYSGKSATLPTSPNSGFFICRSAG